MTRLTTPFAMESFPNNDSPLNMPPPSFQASPYFRFTPDSLAHKLVQESDSSFHGYWHHQFQGQIGSQRPRNWYLGIMDGQAIFSDSRPLSVGRLFAFIERYVPRLKCWEVRQVTEGLQHKLVPQDDDQLDALPALLNSCYNLNLVHPEEVKRALQLKLLEDLDDILFTYGGQAQFVPQADWVYQMPKPGFDLHGLMAEAYRRRLIWDKVKTYLPSVDCQLTLNEAALSAANLANHQEQHLRTLMTKGQTARTMAVTLAQDTLEIARGVAQLIDKGLLNIHPVRQSQEPEILIIDDSPLMLQQFKVLVSHWGYRVRSHSDPTSALTVISQTNPVAIFLDINMPELSGFDLLKQIRRQPSLATIPLVMLTAERTLSNNWRAQWSGCQFLTKPLSPEEIPQFKLALRNLLESIISSGAHIEG